MDLSPDKIQDLVTTAFCLEPLADKKGCTTRYVDMPGKPLEEFLVAGIYASKYFRKLAEELGAGKKPMIFQNYVAALQGSNQIKSAKTINIGLLEIMFPTVYARLLCNNPDKVVDEIIKIMKVSRRAEVDELIQARLEAWKNAAHEERRAFTGKEYDQSQSPYEFYLELHKNYGFESSTHRWAEQYINDLPMLRLVLRRLRELPTVDLRACLEMLGEAFSDLRKEWPEVKPGIIADMCAAGCFLHLSYI